MEKLNSTAIEPISQTQNYNAVSKEKEIQYAPEQIEDGEEKLKKALIALGAITAGALAVGVAVKAGKAYKLSDIDFNKGVANLTDGSKFTGKIKDTLKNGDKIILEYKDGILQNSQRKGSKNFSKVFANIDGERIVTKIENGAKSTTNIAKTTKIAQDEIKAQTLKPVQELQKNADLALDYTTSTKANKSAYESAQVFIEQEQENAGKALDYATGTKSRKSAQASADVFLKQEQENADAVLDYATGAKANKSAQASAKAFQKQEQENADAVLDYVTGAKANKSAQESAKVFQKQEQKNAIKVVDYATGTKANKSAQESARAFIIKDEANLAERVQFLKYDNADLKINPQNYKALKSLKKETLENLSDDFLESELKNFLHFDGIELIEQEFAPAELNKITHNFYGRHLLATFYKGLYNNEKEKVEILEYLHKMAK